MKIEINGKEYVNPDWRVENGIGEIRIRSDAPFTEIANDFVLEEGEKIIQYNDSEQKISEWYVEGMSSIQLAGENDSEVVTIKYHISQLATDAQEALQTDVNDASDAVLELCELIGEQTQTLEETCERIENSQTEQGERLDQLSETLNYHTAAIGNWETMYNVLADRVARLENEGGKQS